MSVSMYQMTVPVFTAMFGNLEAILDKAKVFAEGRHIDESVLLQYRLAPDMYPLSRQVQIATDQATRAMARLAGIELPSFPDTEQSIDQLNGRLQRAAEYIDRFTPQQLDGSDVRAIVMEAGDHLLHFNGLDYLRRFALPNVYFHLSMAYAILRHCGVDIGKRDYIGELT